jgi:hypothetical protein
MLTFWFLYYSYFTYRVYQKLNVKLRCQKVKKQAPLPLANRMTRTAENINKQCMKQASKYGWKLSSPFPLRKLLTSLLRRQGEGEWGIGESNEEFLSNVRRCLNGSGLLGLDKLLLLSSHSHKIYQQFRAQKAYVIKPDRQQS